MKNTCSFFSIRAYFSHGLQYQTGWVWTGGLRGVPFLTSLLLLLHSHRADLGPDTGEGKTQDSSLRTLEPSYKLYLCGSQMLPLDASNFTYHLTLDA